MNVGDELSTWSYMVSTGMFFFPESLIPGCLFKKWFDNVYGTKLIRVLSKVSCLKLGSEMNDFCLKQN